MKHVYLVFLSNTLMRVFSNADDAIEYSHHLESEFVRLEARVDKEQVYGDKDI